MNCDMFFSNTQMDEISRIPTSVIIYYTKNKVQFLKIALKNMWLLINHTTSY